MDLLVASVAGALVAISWIVTVVALRRARRTRRAAPPSPPSDAARVAELEQRALTLAAGEREAAWAGRVLAATVERRDAAVAEMQAALETLRHQSGATEEQLDRVRDDLRATAGELDAARRDLAEATTRLGALETELANRAPGDVAERIAALETDLAAARSSIADHAARERDLRSRLSLAEAAAHADAKGLPEARAEASRLAAREATLIARIEELEAALAAAPLPGADDPSEQVAALAAEVAALRSIADRAESARNDLQAEVSRLRATAATAEADAARLRHDVGAARAEIDRLRSAADDARREADATVAAAGARISELESEARTGTRDAATVVARDARIADLEQRLAALGAARAAELRTLNEKIASMERLYVDVEVRDRRISTLEEDLKDAAEARDAALAELVRLEAEAVELRTAEATAQRSMERLGGIEHELIAARARIEELEARLAGTELGEEVARLRAALEAERGRADRAVQRAALAEPPDPTYAAYDRRLRERVATAVEEATASLRTRIFHLQEVVAEKERRIASLGGVAGDGPDDLTRIRGIGPKIAAILADLGITTFRDIASFSDDDVARVGAVLPVYGRRIIDDDWIGQARALAR